MKITTIISTLLFATSTANASILNIYDNNGKPINDVDTNIIDIRDFDNGIWTLSSSTDFFGSPWVAYNGRVFDRAGRYQFNTGNGYYNVQLNDGYTLGYILIDWAFSKDIDIVNIWDAAGNSIDIDGDGIAGLAMIDGPFSGKSVNFSVTAASQEKNKITAFVDIPATTGLFGSGLIGLLSIARRRA
ncbi:MAG: hypothetical protein GXP22_08475 [Gammaproteobacteria bacterium]|nr:hypothetical protein [Gammaproteobacteria bacterium]